jgi:outer membrane protein assembly factor BamC
VAPTADKAEPGFFGKLFNSSKQDNAPQKFRISVVSLGDATTVSVQNGDGTSAKATDVQRIVQVLADDLK